MIILVKITFSHRREYNSEQFQNQMNTFKWDGQKEVYLK